MILKEKLIQAIERFLSGCVPPLDEILEQLLKVLQTLQFESIENETQAARLHRKQGILIIKTEIKSELDLNQSIKLEKSEFKTRFIKLIHESLV